MDLDLAGAAVAVTGGSKGMGRAIAEGFAGEGARVAVLSRGRAALDDTVDRLRNLGAPDVVGMQTNVARPEEVNAAFNSLGDRWGQLNVLVNTVGPGAGRLEDLDNDAWRGTFELGTMSAVNCVRAALPLLRAAEWARIANLAAHSIQRQSPMLVAYTASKAALASVSKNLARSLAAEGILVNTVSPGTIVTASFTEMLSSELASKGYDATNPVDVMRWIDEVYHHPADLGRAGLPEEVASVVVFLCSRRNGYVTGANINVDGGSDFV